MQEIVRLKPYARQFLTPYGSDASKAIDALISENSRQKAIIEALQNVTPTAKEYFQNTPIPDAAYWKKLETTVDGCIERAKRY